MKYLTILINPIRMKGDPDDIETIQADLNELLQSMIEDGSVPFSIQEDDEEEDELNFD